jgi:DNA-binding transcriptional LysR family regulator
VLHPQLELDVMVADGAAMREAFGAGKLDLALADTVSLRPAPRRQRECPLAWVAAPAFDRREAKSCRWFSPVTRASGACGWYRRSIGVGRPWRTAFESGSLTAIQAAVRAGMGVATLLPWNVENGMAHRDAEANRLPPAPSVKLALYRRPGLRNDPVTDMLEKLLWNAVL